jgi:hypothetical protein
MTGNFLPGKARLADLCDDQSEVLAKLLEGWSRGKGGSHGVVAEDKKGRLDQLKLPAVPTLCQLPLPGSTLEEAAAVLNDHPKGTPIELFGRTYPDRSSARQALLTKLAAKSKAGVDAEAVKETMEEDDLASWLVEHLPTHYEERSNPARDLYTELRRAREYAGANALSLLTLNA